MTQPGKEVPFDFKESVPVGSRRFLETQNHFDRLMQIQLPYVRRLFEYCQQGTNSQSLIEAIIIVYRSRNAPDCLACAVVYE